MDGPVRTSRVRAPELYGAGGWINTDTPLTLAGLRGRIVLLDFWTFCCVNCLHVIDELREIERAYVDVLVTVGVHSPKFVHEADHDALVAAVERYEVDHPVLDDPGLVTWNQYAVRAWPTLAVVDPEGYVVAQMSGEGHGHGLAALLDELIEEHTAKGTLRRGDSYLSAPVVESASELRFPAKVVVLPSGDLLVGDARNHSLAVVSPDDLTTVVRRIGSGRRGRADGAAGEAEFAEPQGVLVLPADVARAVGYDVVVADTANHLLRGLSLAAGSVTTVAGTGKQWMRGSSSGGPALDVDLSTPWDLAWYADAVVVAMAGTHQLWTFDPLARTASVLAGTTSEGLRDGPALTSWMAQPSGLASDGDTLWIADSETSALRVLRDGSLHTVVGQGLFAFGHRDGVADDALLQHPLGVAMLPDGSVAICDTYNNAVRRYDPVTDEVSTLAVGVSEPSGAVVVDGRLVVVESAAHRLSTPVAEGVLRMIGDKHTVQRPLTDLALGLVELEVVFEPPPGQHLDERDGPATRLSVSASPPSLLVAGEGSSTGLTRRLELAAGEGVLHIAAMGASCDVDVEFAACHVHQQDWGIPVRVVAGASSTLTLMLRG
ncbi:redoxin domain-containing protein [Acidothermaceae bacterium B102]|nr:redoxin domain-containing protein [Acidothermaceae bacterium B102]